MLFRSHRSLEALDGEDGLDDSSHIVSLVHNGLDGVEEAGELEERLSCSELG